MRARCSLNVSLVIGGPFLELIDPLLHGYEVVTEKDLVRVAEPSLTFLAAARIYLPLLDEVSESSSSSLAMRVSAAFKCLAVA
jgi:predicted HAD superfamily phosphohydrolase